MAEERSFGVIYIEPNRLLFYSSKINKVLFQDFPPDTVSDLDIVNKDKFTQILNFFIQNALQKAPYDIAMVFSAQTTYEKVLVPTLSKDADALFSEFSSLVPFEEVLSRVYKENKQIKAYAVNKTMYELIADCFMKNGSTINIILPVTLIIEKSPELSNNFDLPAIASKVESLHVFNMIESSFGGSRIQIQQSGTHKGSNKRAYVLGAVFVVLLLFTLFYAYMTFFSKPKTSQIQQSQPTPTVEMESTQISTPTLTPEISPAITQPVATSSSNSSKF